jgi:hypothetical protein
MLIDYVIGALQLILLALIVSGGVLCAREGAREPLRTDRRTGKPDRRTAT